MGSCSRCWASMSEAGSGGKIGRPGPVTKFAWGLQFAHFPGSHQRDVRDAPLGPFALEELGDAFASGVVRVAKLHAPSKRSPIIAMPVRYLIPQADFAVHVDPVSQETVLNAPLGEQLRLD